MKKYLLDTNALLSFITDRNPSQQKSISKYFEEAAKSRCELIIIQNVLTEFVYVLESVYKIKSSKIKNILTAFLNSPGIQIMYSFDFHEILRIWPEQISDYGDAIVAPYAKSEKIPILSFDKSFHKQLQKLSIAIEKF